MATSRRQWRRRKLRILDWVTVVVLFAALAFIVSWLDRGNLETRNGKPTVADGDTLQMGDRRIRLAGIDAPEYHQTCDDGGRVVECGRASRNHLAKLIGGRAVNCSGDRSDQYGRLLGICRAGDVDLNATMVRDGWAVSYNAYPAEEAQARRSRRGLWAMTFDRPRDWRRQHEGSRGGTEGVADESDGFADDLRRALTELRIWATSLVERFW